MDRLIKRVDLGQLADRPPHPLQGSFELPGHQKTMGGCAGGSPVVSVDAPFFSLVPKQTQADRLQTHRNVRMSAIWVKGSERTSSLLLPCP